VLVRYLSTIRFLWSFHPLQSTGYGYFCRRTFGCLQFSILRADSFHFGQVNHFEAWTYYCLAFVLGFAGQTFAQHDDHELLSKLEHCLPHPSHFHNSYCPSANGPVATRCLPRDCFVQSQHTFPVHVCLPARLPVAGCVAQHIYNVLVHCYGYEATDPNRDAQSYARGSQVPPLNQSQNPDECALTKRQAFANDVKAEFQSASDQVNPSGAL